MTGVQTCALPIFEGVAGTFVAGDWTEGRTLRTVLVERAAKGEHLSLKGAYNIIAHLCRALTYAHQTTAHGAIRPEVIWVTNSGRVRLADFGVASALIEHAGVEVLGEGAAALAPEIRAGAKADARADIFGLGAILYELLTGRSPGAAPHAVDPRGGI